MRVGLHASQGTACGFLENDLRKRREEKKHSFHNKHIHIIRVTDILKFYEVLFCTYRTVLFFTKQWLCLYSSVYVQSTPNIKK